MLVLNTHSHICTHTHWCFSYSSVRSVPRWQSSRWLMSRCGTSRNCAFSPLKKALEVPEKYSTSELSSAEIDFNSLLALLKHPTAETWWCSQKREGKSYFSSGKTCGLHAKATVTSTSVHITLEVWVWKAPALRCLWLQCTQEDKVVAWTKEIRCHLILTLNSCAEAQPSLGDGACYIPVVVRWQICNSNLRLHPAGQRARCPPVLPARQAAPETEQLVSLISTYICTYTCGYISTTHLHPYLQTYRLTYTHAYIYTYLYTYLLLTWPCILMYIPA